MKISTRGRYALRLMLDLATYSVGEPISIKDIAKRQDVSEKYLEQIISIISKAGFVKSVRGAQGGYMLVKQPKDYTVGMILRATEGNLAPVECLAAEENDCERVGQCVTLRVWEKLYEAICGVVDNITLADLYDWQSEIGSQYNI